jgi:hypothetical protein
VGSFEHGNERLGSIKFSEFLGSSAAIWLLRLDSVSASLHTTLNHCKPQIACCHCFVLFVTSVEYKFSFFYFCSHLEFFSCQGLLIFCF